MFNLHMPYDYTEPKVMNVDCVQTFVHVNFLPVRRALDLYLALALYPQYVLVEHKAPYTSWTPKVHGHTKHFLDQQINT